MKSVLLTATAATLISATAHAATLDFNAVVPAGTPDGAITTPSTPYIEADATVTSSNGLLATFTTAGDTYIAPTVPGLKINIDFSSAVDLQSLDMGGLGGVSEGNATLVTTNGSGTYSTNLVADLLAGFETIDLSALAEAADNRFKGITEFSFGSADPLTSNPALDNVVYSPIAPVPLPASFPLLALALGGVGLAARRKKPS